MEDKIKKHHYADCMICYDEIFTLKVDDIHILFQDNLDVPVGRPICDGCFELLKEKKPKHVDYLKRYFAWKNNRKLGLEKWLN